MEKLWQHMRQLWPRWTLLPTAPFVAWFLYALFVRGEMGRWELWTLLIVIPLLAYWGPRTKKLFIGLFPIGLVGLFYDAMRFVQYLGITADKVHDCDLHALDARLFGFTNAA